jgi:hypothetical protein
MLNGKLCFPYSISIWKSGDFPPTVGQALLTTTKQRRLVKHRLRLARVHTATGIFNPSSYILWIFNPEAYREVK